MSKSADSSLKTDSGLYKSKIEASKEYDRTQVDNVRLRVPQGIREKMQAHVDSLPKYEVKGKAHHSVNAWLVDLIKKELEIED